MTLKGDQPDSAAAVLLRGIGHRPCGRSRDPPAKARTPIEVPEWLFPIDPKSLEDESQAREARRRGAARDSRQQGEVHAGAHQRSVQRTRLAAERSHSHARDRGARPQACGHGLRLLPHTDRPGTPGKFRAGRTARGVLQGATARLRSGKRKPTGPEAYLPSQNMLKIARAMTDAEIDASAKYFAQQKLRAARVRDREPAHTARRARGVDLRGSPRHRRSRRPAARSHQRTRATRTPRRSPGIHRPMCRPAASTAASASSSRAMAARRQPCATCHLANLKGTDKIPPIAGRSPTYLLRQMLAFRNGRRTGEAAQQMKPVVEKLTLNEMIDVVAYLGSLVPAAIGATIIRRVARACLRPPSASSEVVHEPERAAFAVAGYPHTHRGTRAARSR